MGASILQKTEKAENCSSSKKMKIEYFQNSWNICMGNKEISVRFFHLSQENQ